MKFLNLGIVVYLFAILSNINILYKGAYFFLGLHFLLKFYFSYIMKNIQVDHSLQDDHIFLNEQLNCQVMAENRGRLPVLWLKIREGLPRKLSPEEKKDVVYLKAGERKEWKFSLKGRRRGFYQLGSLQWETGDFLGYNLQQVDQGRLSFYVFPHLLELEKLGLPSRLPFGNIKWPQPIYKDPYQMVGVREYQPADNPRMIHWKATARTGQLQVRENQSTVSLETAIILNLAREDYGLKYLERRVELGVTAAASLASYFTRIDQSYSFKTNGYNPYLEETDSGQIYTYPPGSGEDHLQGILETLACVEASENGGLSELLGKELEIPWGGTIIIITAEDTEELLKTANNLLTRGYSVKLLLTGERVNHPRYLHRPLTSPFSIYQLQREEDIHGLSHL